MENTAWVMPTHIIAAAGVVINDTGDILLVKHHRDGWGFPGRPVFLEYVKWPEFRLKLKRCI